MKLIVSFMLLFFAATIGGCGYSTGSLLPSELTSICVDNFKNNIDPTKELSDRRASYSYRPGLEVDITRVVIDKFIFDRNLKIDSADKSALLLTGTLVDFRQFPLSYGSDNNVEEFRMEIFVDMELQNKLTGETMWKESRFMGNSIYTVLGPNAKTEDIALQDTIEDLAKRIVERTIEVW